MDLKQLQESLDKKFPDGIYVWVNYNDGSGSVDTRLIPRAVVINEALLLLSAFDGSPYYLANPETVDIKDDYVELSGGTRLIRLYTPTDEAKRILKDRVKEAFAPGFLEDRAEW